MTISPQKGAQIEYRAGAWTLWTLWTQIPRFFPREKNKEKYPKKSVHSVHEGSQDDH